MMMSIMAWVFASLFDAEIKSFTVFLFAGMIPWTFFSAVVIQSGSSFINNEGLIKKIYLPKIIFPLSISCALLVDSILSFMALFLIIMALGGSLSMALLFLPFAYILLFFFAFGVGLIMSVVTVFFRDLQHVIIIGMQGLFFLTPILYKKTAMVGSVAWLVELNPVSPYIELFRVPLTQAILPEVGVVVSCTLISLVFFVVGLAIFLYQERNIVFRL